MLIIFDLDDTIIDTSGTVSPCKIKKLIHQLFEKKFLKDQSKAFEELVCINQYSKSMLTAFEEFAQINHLPFEKLLPIYKECVEDTQDLPEVKTTTDAKNILTEIARKHTLAIVTYGEKKFQFEKMKKAGVDTSIFSRILVSQSRMKGPYYQALLDDLNQNSSHTIVCGDRIEGDLVPAKQLGCITVHMKWGRGLSQPKDSKYVDFGITTLKGLMPIISQSESS